MATEFNTGTDASLNEAVKSRYEANADTNAFTDGEKNKLAAIPADAEANAVNSVNGATGAVLLNADDINDNSTAHKFATAAQLSKIDSVEDGATADQTGAEIVSAIDTQLGSSTWQTGGGGGGSTDVVSNVAQDRILGRVSPGSGNSEELSAADVRTFLNVEAGATANSGALADVNTVNTGQIENGAVTLNKMANVATASLLGRNSAGTGVPEVLSADVARNILNVIAATALASNADGEGAALVGIADAGAFTSQTQVEGALQEIYGILDLHGDIVTQDIASFVQKSEQEVVIFDAGGDSSAVRPTQASNKTVIWFNHGSQLPENMGSFDIATGQGYGVANVATQTGTSYVLVRGDEGTSIDMDNVAANVVTIPDNATEALPVGSCIAITQLGAGGTTISAAAGVSLNGNVAGSVSINNRFSGATLRKIATDEWIIQGDVS